MRAIETNGKIVSRLRRDGWVLVRHGGGHDVYRHAEKQGAVVVPRHRMLSQGVARSIARAAGWV